DFINNFSHEFKTPIVSIRGFAHQLRYEDLPPEKREEYLEIICKESDRLAHMASRILLLSKYENLSIVTEKTSYDLDEQIRHCILLLEKQWDEKELELDIELDTVRCYSNEEMLSQLWVNLLGNAVKFTPHGGTVGVSLRQEGEMAIVKVTDTGDGIPDDVRAHIFDKFYQGDTSHKSEGNGIGLTLVHRIVELCNGTIEVESTVGEGSTFTVRLPVAETVAELEQTLNERSRKESTHEPDGQL
ncbi:MAG: HAMP domain-containing histidine kinase, partial [Clostridia bacterium]|nr:HAMP domain-containing histidine kinase [Clostridia bacterium]